MNRVVIDTDPGIDDAHALMMAFAHPHTKVEAITTVAGNVPLERTTANALIILDMLGVDTPVFSGCEDALVKKTLRRATSHGFDGLGNSGYPLSSRQVSSEHAAHALINLANESPGELSLVALGPLTNIAMAISLDPTLPGKYKSLTVLGGAIYGMGNSWMPAAEFNFYIDPESAAIVLERWPGMTIIPWETSMKFGLSSHVFGELSGIDSPQARFFQRIFNERFSKQIKELGICYDPDPLAMAVELEPDILRETKSQFVKIELEGKLTRGQSVVDWFNILGQPANANLVLDVDRERFLELLKISLK